MQEIWKDVKGYEGLYQVSNLGRVKSLGNGGSKNSKEKVMKETKDKYGYLTVNLSKDGKPKHYKVHRLVALVFLPNPDNLHEINHKDENKTNNIAENLEWCDRKYNINYGTRNIRSAEKNSESQTNHPKFSKRVLCIETGKIYPSTHQIEREFGFANGYISAVCLGKRKTAYGFHWRYTE